MYCSLKTNVFLWKFGQNSHPRFISRRSSPHQITDLHPNITCCLFSELTFCSSGTNTFLAFLIMGCGFSSSSENLCLRGLKSSPPGTLDRTRSVGSGWKLMSTSMASGSMGDGVLRSSALRATGVGRKSELGHRRGRPNTRLILRTHWALILHQFQRLVMCTYSKALLFCVTRH